MKVCRICLSKDGRLYPITSNELLSLYHQITGLPKLEMQVDKMLPQWVCAECGLRLLSYNKLREKSLKSYQILYQLLHRVSRITEKDINQIDREKNGLKSNLSYNVLDNGIIQEYVVDIQESNKTDCKHELKIKEYIIDLKANDTDRDLQSERDYSDEAHSENAVSDTENNLNLENDPLSDCASFYNLKNEETRNLKMKTKNLSIDIEKHVDKHLETIVTEINTQKSKKIDKKKIKVPLPMVDYKIENDASESETAENQTEKAVKKVVTKKSKVPIEDSETEKELDFISESEVSFSEKNQNTKKEKTKKTRTINVESDLDDVSMSSDSDWMERLQGITDNLAKIEDPNMLYEIKHDIGQCLDILTYRKPTRKTPVDHAIEKMFTVETLSYKEQKKEFENRKFSNYYIMAEYQCNICFNGYKSVVTFNKHMLLHSDKGGNKECKMCKLRFHCNKTAYKHYINVHRNRYSCKQCTFKTSYRNSAQIHGISHRRKVYKCTQCDEEFVTRHTYNVHVKKYHVEFVCEFCGLPFASKYGAAIHKAATHSSEINDTIVSTERFMCVKCDKKFMSEEALNMHNQLSHPEMSNRPGWPGVKRFTNPPKKRAVCEICGFQITDYKRKRGFYSHLRRFHPNVNPSDFLSYNPKKNVLKKLICEQCGRAYGNITKLNHHILTVHNGVRPYECDYCHKTEIYKVQIKEHIMRKHLRMIPKFKCDYCQKIFYHKKDIFSHITRVHLKISKPKKRRPRITEGKPENNLKTKIKGTKVKKYKRQQKIVAGPKDCDICGKVFSNTGNRKRHMIIHTGLRPFTCETCGSSFKTRGEVKAHTEHVHLKVPWPKKKEKGSQFQQGV